MLKLTTYDDAASFVAVATPLLAQSEAENSMIAIPAARMSTRPSPDDAGTYFAIVWDGAFVVSAALQPSKGGVMLTPAPAAAVALIARDMADRRRRPRSVLGPLDACEAFARCWRGVVGDVHILRFHLRHFELRDPPPAPSIAGVMRAPHLDERELVASWHADFATEVHLYEDPSQHRRSALRRLDAGQVRLWDDDAVVAYAGYTCAQDIARIAPVYTPPQRRGRGYASALVAALSRQLFDSGKRAIFLTTDVANPTSNRIYQQLGYRAMADHFHFELVKADS